jgi:amino acid transporter
MRVLVADERRDAVFDITGVRYIYDHKTPVIASAYSYHVWGLLVCAIYWGIFDTQWVTNLTYGIGTQLVCMVILLISNIFTAFCICEMISAIPAGGGIVAFARVGVGQLAGFLFGVMAFIDFVTTTSLATLFWANYIQDIFNTDEALLTLWSALIYIGSCSLIMVGGRTMWDFVLLSGVVTTLLIFLYLLTAMIHGNFSANAFMIDSHFYIALIVNI